MHIWKVFSFIFCICLAVPKEILAQDDDEFTKEISYGIVMATNGGLIGGGMFKYAKILNEKTSRTFGLEIVGIKHPKEITQSSPITEGNFIVGKQNYLFAIRPQYGREITLFKKAPQEGIKINAIIAGGPTLGIVKPYLILYDFGSGIVTEQYDPNKHQASLILGSGGFFSGFDKAKVVPGLNLKTGLSFEFGAFQNVITGLEVGLVVEGYSNKIILMPLAQNNQLFTSGYLTWYFGFRK